MLSAVSQVGLVLYMFVVGMHLHTDFIRQAFRGAMLISLAGVVAPFVLGAALASFLYADGRFFTPNVSSWQSMMYLGAAMSVTAFPVLARIIQERGIGGTALGTLALAAGCGRRHDRVVPARRRARQRRSAASTSCAIRRRSHAVFVAFVVGALRCRADAARPADARADSRSEPVAFTTDRAACRCFFCVSRGLSTRSDLDALLVGPAQQLALWSASARR